MRTPAQMLRDQKYRRYLRAKYTATAEHEIRMLPSAIRKLIRYRKRSHCWIVKGGHDRIDLVRRAVLMELMGADKFAAYALARSGTIDAPVWTTCGEVSCVSPVHATWASPVESPGSWYVDR